MTKKEATWTKLILTTVKWVAGGSVVGGAIMLFYGLLQNASGFPGGPMLLGVAYSIRGLFAGAIVGLMIGLIKSMLIAK